MSRRKKLINRTDIPQYQIEAIARCSLTRILRRGLEAAEDHCLLSATALNLKRMIKWLS